MVFGIGEGSVDIVTEKQSYVPGETIKGKITLTLNGAKKAKELRVAFYGEIITQRQSSSHDSHGHHHTHSQTQRINEQVITLGGEQEYPAGTKEYEFQFQVPQFQTTQPTQAGALGAIVGALANAGNPYAQATWHIDASLNIPMSFDINKKIRINVVR